VIGNDGDRIYPAKKREPMTTGPPRIYIPVCPGHYVGGPVGYVRRSGLAWKCPLTAYREPVTAEIGQVQTNGKK